MWLVRPAVLTQVLGIVYRAISPFLIRRAGLRVGAGARTGAVTLIQRFGSARNLNIQLQTTTPILPQLCQSTGCYSYPLGRGVVSGAVAALSSSVRPAKAPRGRVCAIRHSPFAIRHSPFAIRRGGRALS